MSAVNEEIVREFFETQGFLVRQPQKYQVVARAKRAGEEIDLFVLRHDVPHQPPDKVLWGVNEVQQVSRALVSIRGWHTDIFSVKLLSDSPAIFRFAEADNLKQAERVLGPGPVARVLCVPNLPSHASQRDRALALMRERGVDGVLLFRTMLQELVRQVNVNKFYDKSDLLQVLRLLKHYDLLKGPQLELFRKSRMRRTRNAKTNDVRKGAAAE